MTSYFDYLPSELIHQIMFYNINVPILAEAFPHLKHIIYNQFIRQRNFRLYTELLNVSNKINIPISNIVDILLSSNTTRSVDSEDFVQTVDLTPIYLRDPYEKYGYEQEKYQEYDLTTFNLAFLRRYPKVYEYYYSNKNKFDRTFNQMISKFVSNSGLDPQDQEERKYAKEQLEQDKVYFDIFKSVTPYQLYHAVNEYRSYKGWREMLDNLFLDESTIDDIISLI